VRWAVIAAVGLIGLAAGIYFGTGSAPDQKPIAAAALRGLALPDADGTEQRMDQWRGKVVIVNFWATWCAPCREEMPEFIKAQKDLGPKGLQIVGIAVDQPDKVRQFAAEIGVNYPTLVGGFGAMELSKTLGNTVMALPFTVIVDRQGGIAHTQLGVLKPDKLNAIVRQLL
jgi:thiol-disulfide isomerase/thioredoxin